MSSHHSDQMSERSHVSRVVLWGCSLNIFVIVIVLAFVIVFFWSGHVSSSLWSDVSHGSQVSGVTLWVCFLNVWVFVSSGRHSDPMSQRSEVSRTLLLGVFFHNGTVPGGYLENSSWWISIGSGRLSVSDMCSYWAVCLFSPHLKYLPLPS